MVMYDYIGMLLDAQLARVDTVVGCSQDELARIQSISRIQLPDDYMQFMSQVGKCAGQLFLDAIYMYPHLLDIRYDFELPDPESPYFIWNLHRDEDQYLYMQDDGGAFPVFRYSIDANEKVRLAESFYEFIAAHIVHSKYILSLLPQVGRSDLHRQASERSKRARSFTSS